MLGAPPLVRSNRKIAIHPLSFGRNQSVCQSSSPERAEAWVDKAVQSWQMVFALGSRHILLLPQWQYYRCVPLPQRCLTLRGSQTRPVATIPEISPLALSSLSVFASRFCTFTDVSACPYMVDEDE